MKKFTLLILSLFLISGYATAQEILDLTIEQTSATEAIVNVNGHSGVTANVTTTKELIDGEEYTATQDTEYSEITYKRTFNHTEWQALYVPFTMDYNDLKSDFEIGRIIQITQTDEGHLHVAAQIIESGTLKANYPYFIKPKTTGEKVFKANSNKLYKATNKKLNCGTIDFSATFTGTYTTITDMADNGFFAMSNGRLKQAVDNSATLAPFRWYLFLEDNEGTLVINEIKLRIDRSGTTGIESIEDANIATPVYYDLSGRKVENPTRGIYIVNGKKVLVK